MNGETSPAFSIRQALRFHQTKSASTYKFGQFHTPRELGFKPERQESDLGRIMPYYLFLLGRRKVIPGCNAGFEGFPGTYSLCPRCAALHYHSPALWFIVLRIQYKNTYLKRSFFQKNFILPSVSRGESQFVMDCAS